MIIWVGVGNIIISIKVIGFRFHCTLNRLASLWKFRPEGWIILYYVLYAVEACELRRPSKKTRRSSFSANKENVT